MTQRGQATASQDAVALKWVARLFLAIGIGAAIVCIRLGIETLRFISTSTQAEGIVVDWSRAAGALAGHPNPGPTIA